MNVRQEEKLRALLEHARRSTARYANLLPQITESSNPFELLNQLPLLTKQELRREKARLYSTTGDTSSWRVASTTGTTGEPVDVVLDERSRKVETAVLADHFDRRIGTVDWRTRNVIHLVLHAGATSRAVPSPWNPLSLVTKWNLLQAWQTGDEQFLDSLKHIHGHVVTTMPSVAQLLAARLSNSNSRVRPLLLVLSGEKVEPQVAEQVARVFDCPVTSLYTTTEAGIIGKPCPQANSYHVEERNVFLEIVDEEARSVGIGCEGEIVVTPLENYAMPLIRYRTGDRGRWCDGVCECGDPAPRFQLTTSRRPARLVAATGAAVNVVRFAKIFASFDLQRYGIFQREDGTVVISYLASHPLDGASVSVMKAAVRAALGPEITVQVRRVTRPDEINNEPGPLESNDVSQPIWSSFERCGLDLTVLVDWLRERLAREQGIEYAVLTGSALDPDATTRFSDIDLVLFLQGDVREPRWINLAQQLRSIVPKLSVNVDRLIDLPQRAPLITCRLLSEQLPVLGRLDLLAWPSKDDLRREGQLWAQQAAAVLWHQLTSPMIKVLDPVREAWIATKFGLNALRYRYLVCGGLETASSAIIKRALQDKESSPWLDDLIEAFDIARELKPPPLATTENIRSYFAAAWFCVHSIATEFLDQ